MKRSTKITSIIIIFFLIIATVIIGRQMIGMHFQKKFSKRPLPGIIVTTVNQKNFHNKISTFGTAVPIRTKAYKIEKYTKRETIIFFGDENSPEGRRLEATELIKQNAQRKKKKKHFGDEDSPEGRRLEATELIKCIQIYKNTKFTLNLY